MASASDRGDLDRLVAEQAGVLTYAQASRCLGPVFVRGRLRRGQWQRLCTGVVATHNGSLTHSQQLWAAIHAAGPGAQLAGSTAATEAGVRGLRATAIQILVCVPRNPTGRLVRMSPAMPLIHIRRTTVLPLSHLRQSSPPRTTTARAVVDAASWADNDNDARTIVASACQQRRVSTADLRDVLNLFPRLRRHRLIHDTVNDVAGGAEALSEIDFMALCRRYRLALPSLQYHRADPDGRKRYLDAYWTEQRLHVEIDGGHHMEVQHWAADMLRQNRIWIRGDRILRFPAWLVRTDPTAVAAQLREALNAAPAPG